MEFTFAGFTFPRMLADMACGRKQLIAKRSLADYEYQQEMGEEL